MIKRRGKREGQNKWYTRGRGEKGRKRMEVIVMEEEDREYKKECRERMNKKKPRNEERNEKEQEKRNKGEIEGRRTKNEKNAENICPKNS